MTTGSGTPGTPGVDVAALVVGDCWCESCGSVIHHDEAVREAADEIEALRAEVAALRDHADPDNDDWLRFPPDEAERLITAIARAHQIDPTDVDGEGSYESVVLDLAEHPDRFPQAPAPAPSTATPPDERRSGTAFDHVHEFVEWDAAGKVVTCRVCGRTKRHVAEAWAELAAPAPVRATEQADGGDFDVCAVPDCFYEARYGAYCNGHKRLPPPHIAFPPAPSTAPTDEGDEA